jgi:hypothetical protein
MAGMFVELGSDVECRSRDSGSGIPRSYTHPVFWEP